MGARRAQADTSALFGRNFGGGCHVRETLVSQPRPRCNNVSRLGDALVLLARQLEQQGVRSHVEAVRAPHGDAHEGELALGQG